MVGLRVDLLPLLGPDLGLDVLDRPPILLQLGAHHSEARLHLGLPRGVQRGVLADQVLVLVFIVCLWCNLKRRLYVRYRSGPEDDKYKIKDLLC